MAEGFLEPDSMPGDVIEHASANVDESILTQLQDIINDATVANNNADDALGMAIAACLVECQDANGNCAACLGGQIQNVIDTAQTVVDRTTNKINDAVSSTISDAISVATNFGVPLTDLVLVNGVPITTDGVPNDTSVPPDTTIQTVICPSGTTPELTGNGTIECTSPTTGITSPPTVVTGTGSGGLNGSSIVPIGTTPSQQPTTFPTTNPALPGSPPASRPQQTTQQVPACVYASLPAGAIIIESHQLVGGSWYIGYNMPDGCNYWIQFGIAGNNCTVEGSGIVPGCVPLPTQPTEPPVVPPESTGGTSLCPCPTSTAGSGPSGSGPGSMPPFPFCDPATVLERTKNLSIVAGREIAPPGKEPNQALIAPAAGTVAALAGTGVALSGVGIGEAILGALATYSLVQAVGQTASQIVPTAISTAVGSALDGVAKWALNWAPAVGCSNPEFIGYATANAIPSFLGKFGGIFPPQYYVPNEYSMNFLCPYLIPSSAEFNAMSLKGIISDGQWGVGVRANGYCPEWQALVREISRTVPTVDQAAMAFRRNLITYDDFKFYASRNGITEDNDKALFYNLTEFIPGPSDLVRFMVRDAFDEQVATDLQLDKDFSQKFTGKAQEWAKAQGMSEDQFRFFWRSHWQIPSYGQLTEALHRITEDTPLPGGQGVAKAVSVDQVRRAIEINDMSPEWVDRLIAISYRPLSRVDARRAFEIEAITEKELRKSYTDLGYSPDDADKLVDFSVEQAAPKQAKAKGNASTSEVLQWYRDGLIPKDQAYELLFRSGVRKDRLDGFLDTAELRRVTAGRKQAMAALKKRFMTGEFNDAEINQQLIDIGIPAEVTGQLRFQWGIIRDAKYKAPTVGMLCDWWSHGLIDMNEFEKRVTNLGFSMIDASRIIQRCQGNLQEKLAKEAEKLAKEAEAKERKRQADLRRLQNDAKRQQKEIAAAIKAAAPCKPPPKPVCGANGSPQGSPQP